MSQCTYEESLRALDSPLQEKFSARAKGYLQSFVWQQGLKKLKDKLQIEGIHIFKANWCGYCERLKIYQAPELFYRKTSGFA